MFVKIGSWDKEYRTKVSANKLFVLRTTRTGPSHSMTAKFCGRIKDIHPQVNDPQVNVSKVGH